MEYIIEFDPNTNMFMAFCKRLELRISTETQEETELLIQSLIKFVDESGILNGNNAG